MNFDPRDYAPAISELIDIDRLPALGPGEPVDAARPALAAVSVPESFAPHSVEDAALAECCHAGLWLFYDYLEAGHLICQEISTAEGSYWHAIMHRREPDYGNAKYWFRRVGHSHPVYEPLAVAARELAAEALAAGDRSPVAESLAEISHWDSASFVDLCERHAGGENAGNGAENGPAPLCQLVARAEWRLLFDYCYSGAIG